MSVHYDKGLEISYNYLNLPGLIISTVPDSLDRISYIYDASGVKLQKYYQMNVGTVKKPSYSYINSYYGGNVLKLGDKEIILTGEGRMVLSDTSWVYEYFLQDHLGNTRVAFFADTVTAIPNQYNDYYPFGMEMTVNDQDQSDNLYRYNGKELQSDGLNQIPLDWYDYGARFYDPSLGRWHTVDPLAESYYNFSPYNYVLNNPLIFIDPDGRDVDLSNLYQRNEDGELIYRRQVLAFELFAATKAGQSYLKDRAQEGFEFNAEFVSDASFTTESAGELSGKIDVTFGVADLSKEGQGIGANGKAPAEMLDNGKLSLSFYMDDGDPNAVDFKSESGGMRILKNVDTWHHEVFIHGDAHEKRFNAGDYKGKVGKVNSLSYEHGSPYLRNKSSYYKGNQTYYNLIRIRDKYNLKANNDAIWNKIIFHGYNSW